MQEITSELLIHFSIEMVIFLVVMAIGMFIVKRVRNSSNQALNPHEYLPEEEIQTLKQVFYLIMMALFFVDFVYSFIVLKGEIFYLTLFDVALCLFAAVLLDKESWKNKLIVFFLLPFGSFSYLLFGSSFLFIFDVIHIPILLYIITVYYRKFREYTESNGLGFTIILLFAIIFFSFILTMGVENRNPLDSLVMVSNAFTSNGYAVLGNSVVGKINSLLLVWGGYVISGAGTATLTAAILLKYFNRRIKRLEKLIDDEEVE
ncbi:MAG: hypothetical protein U0L42_05180 [Methanobrevibacter sp.]|uniref:hypothetical protein n=1 Tax=Methanobrevibacter sp. TaxID=66852 RepID=UPI002E79FAC9|nr:hypothetical protein [Methanobrevibacter sp.]MEE0935047.1 hypothetical protein [Methanobrevibacter sp.]